MPWYPERMCVLSAGKEQLFVVLSSTLEGHNLVVRTHHTDLLPPRIWICIVLDLHSGVLFKERVDCFVENRLAMTDEPHTSSRRTARRTE